LTDIAWIKAELLRALTALAADGDAALTDYPIGCARADELGIDYSHFLQCVVANCPDLFDRTQMQLLERIDDMLDTMSGEGNSELWADEAVRSSDEWRQVRSRAQAALPVVGSLLRQPS